MDDTFEYFRKLDIERAAEELNQAMEPEEIEEVSAAERHLYGAPARDRYNS